MFGIESGLPAVIGYSLVTLLAIWLCRRRRIWRLWWCNQNQRRVITQQYPPHIVIQLFSYPLTGTMRIIKGEAERKPKIPSMNYTKRQRMKWFIFIIKKMYKLRLPLVDLQSEQLAPKDCLFYQWKLYNLWLNPAFLPSFSSKLSRIARKKWGNISRCNKMRKIVSVCQYVLVTKIYWHRKKLVVYLF